MILLELQALRPTLAAVSSIGDVLAAPFRGRPNKPESLLDSLRDFWTACFGDTVSAADVSSELRPCILAISSGEPASSSPAVALESPISSSVHPVQSVPEVLDLPSSDIEMDDDDDDDDEPLSFPDSEDEVEGGLFSTPPHSVMHGPLTPALSVTPCLKRRGVMLASEAALYATRETLATAPSSPFPQLPPDSTPVTLVLSEPSVTPMTPTTPKRTSSSPARSAKPRSIRGYDKENTSPSFIMSVMDRMAAQAVSPSKLGKRAGFVPDEDVDDHPPAKRVRLEASPRLNIFGKGEVAAISFYSAAPAVSPSKPSSSSSKRALSSVSKLLFDAAEDNSDASDSDATPTKPMRQMKRKRRVMDSVEVPTLQCFQELERRKRHRSFDSASQQRPGPMRQRAGLRRTQSVALPMQGSAIFVTPAKRRRGSVSDARDRTPTQGAGLTPMRALFDMDHINSGSFQDLPPVLSPFLTSVCRRLSHARARGRRQCGAPVI
jgi:hypothetical protein